MSATHYGALLKVLAENGHGDFSPEVSEFFFEKVLHGQDNRLKKPIIFKQKTAKPVKLR